MAERTGEREVAERVREGVIAARRDRVLHLEGHVLVEMNGLLLAVTDLADDELNAAVVARKPEDPLEAIAIAEQWFRWRGRRFAIEVEVGRHPDVDRAIRMMGLELAAERPAMAALLDEVSAPDAPQGVELLRVRTPEELWQAALVNVEAFGMLREVARRLIVPDVLEGPETRVYLARLDGEPVACASTHLHERALGVFGVGTVVKARRRGIGTAITAFALQDRKDQADLAWLHPTEMGRRMYEAMGFRPVSRWAVFVRRDPWF